MTANVIVAWHAGRSPGLYLSLAQASNRRRCERLILPMLKATIPVVAILLLVPAPSPQVPAEQIATTAHQPLPANTSDLWLVPSAADVTPAALTPYKPLIEGAAHFANGDYAGA